MEEDGERFEKGEREDLDNTCPGLLAGSEEKAEMQEEDEEDEEEVMVVKEVKKVQEVEMEEEKETGGAVGPMGSADLRTTKVKATKKA